MSVEDGKIVTLGFDLCTEEGDIVETSDISGPISFMVGKGGMLPGVDKNLIGMAEGEEKTFDLPPEDAFGRPEDGPTKPIPRGEFPAGVPLEVGAAFEAGMGGGQTIRLEVVEVGEDVVTVRMVHPLAGKTLSMTARIIAVREPTAKEVEAGRALVKPPPPPPKG